MGRTPVGKRTSKAVTNQLNKLVKKYGFDMTRRVCNRYFNAVKAERKLNRLIMQKKVELHELRKKL